MQSIFGTIPQNQREAAAMPLPGIRPVAASDWIIVDQCYGDQIAEKQRLLSADQDAVLAQMPVADTAAQELLAEVVALLRGRPDFDVAGPHVTCPDGRCVDTRADPLLVLSQLLQEDLVIHQQMGDVHGMTAALLCFPASWTLAQKIGKPLMAIHAPVAEYDPALAKLVQRLFDGLQVGRPLWCANFLRYDDPALFQPRAEGNPRPVGTDASRYERSERQTLVRLPHTRAVVFAIHTIVAQVASG